MMPYMIRAFVVFCLLLIGMSPAEHAVFTKKSADQGGLLSLLGANTDRIEAHFFRAHEVGLYIVDEGDGQPRYGSLEAAMKKERCLAGVNGGYFGADVARTPIGLVRHAGVTISPFSAKGFTVAGVVYDTGETIRMERSSRLRAPLESMREAIQGGPFLLEQGRAIQGLEKTKKASRTFIATDGSGRWCIAVTSPLTLHELAVWLAQKGSMGGFRVYSALNLDGGSSSAFWDAETSLPGFKAVRNYVGVRPRTVIGGSAAGRGNTPPAR